MCQESDSGKITEANFMAFDIAKCRQAEMNLYIKEQAINSSIIAIALADLDGILTYVNPAFLRLWGYEHENEVVGRPVMDFWKGSEKAAAILKNLMEKGSYEIQLDAKIQDNEIKFLHITAAMVYTQGGKPIQIMASFKDMTKHKKAEQRIKERHQGLLTVLDNTAALIYVADMETYEILFINEYGKKNLGNVVGKKCWKVIQAGQTGPCEFCTNDKLLDANGQPTGTYIHEHKNNRNNRWYECRDIALRWVDGRMVRMEMAADITQRKQAQEEELKVYEQIVSSSNDFMSLVDREYRYRFVNKSYTKKGGFKKEDIIGRHVSEFLGEQAFHDTVKPAIDRCFSGETVNYAAWFDLPGLGCRYVDVTYSPCFSSEDSKVVGAAVVSRDITERKQAEDALNESRKKLQASEAKYRLLVDNTPDHIYSYNPEMRYIAVNQSLCKTFQLESHEIIGKNNYELNIPKDLAQEFEKQILKVLETEKSVEAETTIIIPDGTKHTYNTVLMPVFDEKGMITSITGTNRDITEHKKLEQEIFKIDKLESISTLAGGIAHDFNNYLAALLGNTSLAKFYIEDPQKVLEKLENIEQAILRVKDLSNQLFTFANGAAPVKKTVSIKQSLVSNVKFTLSGSNVCCKFYIDENLYMVEIDEGQFSQVLNNIVINSLQAMPDGGELYITAENTEVKANFHASLLPEGNYVKITIRDEGVGIPKEYINKIFDPFFTTKQQGSGLGLATCYSIIKNHGGYISAESETEVGTSFFIYLPASNRDRAQVPAVENISYGTGKILIMDDQEDLLKVAEEILTTIGYNVSHAKNGQETIEKYMDAQKNGCPFDLVILDLTIPGGMGGKDTLKELLKKDPEVKAIVSSGYSEDSSIANYKGYGFKGAIKKPFSIEKLSNVVHNTLTY
ncbi:PAS domain S-box protein [Candidatus Contubernalis alkaliaceticus]|uniref:PAS domain S-box protein n=1 Tax=Candidatus Contubernalis alkaliaceticus TaxID=338645 RepID=UPI001F4C0674|nr:PAS domain S-box protein [Candidatus Contubernalis alkalaceticus]UNC91338.1 PAS domain S-box protein [Candidatus Contubernalis alkalaceticus]